jgi:hypothetical protein
MGLMARLWITFYLASNRPDQSPTKAEALWLLGFVAIGTNPKKPVISGA